MNRWSQHCLHSLQTGGRGKLQHLSTRAGQGGRNCHLLLQVPPGDILHLAGVTDTCLQVFGMGALKVNRS